MPSKKKQAFARLRHDLRTPINQILGYSELLQEDLAEQGIGGLDDLDKIRKAAGELLQMIEARLTKEHFKAPEKEPATSGVTSAQYGKIKNAAPATTFGPRESRSEVAGRILVVDDELQNRDVLLKHLERQGHSTAGAENGRQAIQMLSEEAFDLVLLDVAMPEMDGYTALGQLKADPA
ncbi:MAG TPA: response regulator, partial [Terrimicrobiaceae bacterium]